MTEGKQLELFNHTWINGKWYTIVPRQPGDSARRHCESCDCFNDVRDCGEAPPCDEQFYKLIERVNDAER